MIVFNVGLIEISQGPRQRELKISKDDLTSEFQYQEDVVTELGKKICGSKMS